MTDKVDVQKARDAATLISALQSTRDRLMPVLAEEYGDVFDGDFDVMLDAINFIKCFRSTLTGAAQ